MAFQGFPTPTEPLPQLKRRASGLQPEDEDSKRACLDPDALSEDVSMSEATDSEPDGIFGETNGGTHSEAESVEDTIEGWQSITELRSWNAEMRLGIVEIAATNSRVIEMISEIAEMDSRVTKMISDNAEECSDIKSFIRSEKGRTQSYLSSYVRNALVDVARRVPLNSPTTHEWLERWEGEFCGNRWDDSFQAWLENFATHVTDAQLEEAEVPSELWSLFPQLHEVWIQNLSCDF